VKAVRSAVLAGALAALAGCDAERILAVMRDATSPGDAGGTPNDAGGNPNDAGGNPGDAGGNPGDGGLGFGMPQPVPGLRSDTDEVQDPALTFEGLELYFTSPTGGQNDIWVSRKALAADPWGPSTLVTELSSPQNDEDPEVSVDGLIMYFASDRGGDGRRLYASCRRTRDTPWEMPARVDTLGSSTLDKAPALDRGQIYLVFASQRGTASAPHLFAATRPDSSAAWQSATEITALTSAWQDSDPALYSDGRGLLFASRRLTQGQTADLFQAERPNVSAPFASSLAPISELNTSANEEDPWISQDGRHILFVSDRSGRRRIYEAWR
jgi:Tol biopolymer transport system component